MADIGKLLGAVKLQLAIVVILGIISYAITYTVYSGVKTIEDLALVAANPLNYVATALGLISLIVIIWAGYAAAKTVKGGAIDGGLSGALIALISGIIGAILAFALPSPLTTLTAGMASAAGVDYSGLLAMGMVIGIIISAIVGFILGAIGGFIGRKK